MPTGKHRQPSIEIDGAWRTQGRGPHDDPEVRTAYSLLHAETLVFFLTGMELTHFSIIKREADYLVMLKGKRKGVKYVAFLNAATFQGACVLAATSLDSGYLSWKLDTPLPKR